MSQEAYEDALAGSNLNSKEVHSTVLYENCQKPYGLHYGSRCQPGSENGWRPIACSVDAATAPSPSQYNDKLNAALRPLPLPQTYCIACGSIYHTAPSCPQNNAAMAGTVADIRPSGVPCPNCQQLGPHMCPAHDALRWAQQEEFNLATARKLRQMTTQIDALRTDLQDVRLMAEHPLHVAGAIGSDVPAAAAPSSPNYDDILQRTHDLAARLTALEAARRKTHVTAWESAPKVAVSGAWIACSERMPPANSLVLTYGRGEVWYTDIDTWEGVRGWAMAPADNLVTHWQPLPAPPIAANPAI